ncbi:hypothetical protein N7520_010309 [Penicillium odoratum]|uniref:uncharacterized protein n=1 Tax=Penicillium odoratum TaxID=1167516 RepID=UPI0025471704|nr:uncharacterized protein N7520_010309 [Penicillium odoratum]KAJ5745127.1 hypothetical protein N7520_010309 [Penicillium odoratum]
MKNPLHNPLPASLSSECKKAAAILESFIDPKLKIDGEIPRKMFLRAKGIAIYTAFRVGFLGSVRFGSGLIVARLPDGSWSAPSAMAMGGIGAGGQFGAELTDFVFVLTTDVAVKTFMQSGSVTLGGNISMAVGPVGRTAEAGGVMGTKGATGVFAYSKTRGLYGGLTVEGGVLAERSDANKKLYRRKIGAKELLTGVIPSPPEAEPLMTVLNGDYFQLESSAQPTAGDSSQAFSRGVGTSGQSNSGQPQQIVASSHHEAVVAEMGVEERANAAESPTKILHDAPIIPELPSLASQPTSIAEPKPELSSADAEIAKKTTLDDSKTDPLATMPSLEQALSTELQYTVSQVGSTSQNTASTAIGPIAEHLSPVHTDAERVAQVTESTNDVMLDELKTKQPEPATERVSGDPESSK